MRFLYSLIFYLLLPLFVLRLWLRSFRAPAYGKRWGERFGFVVPLISTAEKVIWVHAVSVGETVAAIPLIRHLQAQHPEAQLVVTTMTPTGSDRVKAELGNSVYHCYAPYDTPGAVQRFLKRVRPTTLVIMETELWPNLIHYIHRSGVPVILANARMSARSARGYGRISALIRPVLKKLTVVAAQYQGDAQRLQALGVPPDRLVVTGNIKFDIEPTTALRQEAASLQKQWRWDSDEPRFVILAASTHRGEDEQLIKAFQMLQRAHREVLLVLVPRHPERFDEVVELCHAKRLRSVTRSSGEEVRPDTEVLVVDTMGELMLFCGAADVAFVGGSLVAVGGHNPIEPASWGVPVLMGPHVFNFAVVTERLIAGGGLTLVEGPEQLAAEIQALITDEELRRKRGVAAYKVAQENRGALLHLINLVEVWM